MKLFIAILLLMAFCFSANAISIGMYTTAITATDAEESNSDKEGNSESMFIAVATYSIFVVSAIMVTVGALKDNERLFNVAMPIMTATTGFYLGRLKGRF